MRDLLVDVVLGHALYLFGCALPFGIAVACLFAVAPLFIR